jgi:hypothetical protein
MDAVEKDVCNYLKGWPGQFVGTTEKDFKIIRISEGGELEE